MFRHSGGSVPLALLLVLVGYQTRGSCFRNYHIPGDGLIWFKIIGGGGGGGVTGKCKRWECSHEYSWGQVKVSSRKLCPGSLLAGLTILGCLCKIVAIKFLEPELLKLKILLAPNVFVFDWNFDLHFLCVLVILELPAFNQKHFNDCAMSC